MLLYMLLWSTYLSPWGWVNLALLASGIHATAQGKKLHCWQASLTQHKIFTVCNKKTNYPFCLTYHSHLRGNFSYYPSKRAISVLTLALIRFSSSLPAVFGPRASCISSGLTRSLVLQMTNAFPPFFQTLVSSQEERIYTPWLSASLEKPDPLLEIVPLPNGHPVEVVFRDVEGHLEVGVAEMFLQVAPVQIGREFVVGGEEDVERIDFVLAGECLLVVVSPAIAKVGWDEIVLFVWSRIPSLHSYLAYDDVLGP